MDSKCLSNNDMQWQSRQHFKQKAKLDSHLCRFANLFFWHWYAINLVTTSKLVRCEVSAESAFL